MSQPNEGVAILNTSVQNPNKNDDEEHDEDYDKNRKRAYKGFKGYMIIAVTCLVGFVAFIFILPSDAVSNPEKKSSIRHKSNPVGTDERKVVDLLSDGGPDDEESIYSEGTSYLNDAKKIVATAEEEAFSKSNEYLNDVLKDVEVTIKKAIEQFLEKKHGYNPDQVTEIENEIFSKLETQVHQRLQSDSSLITKDAEQDMDTVFENDVMAKVDLENLEQDVDAMRDYFVEEAQKEVDYVAQDIKKNIRDIAEKVEKDVIAEKLDIVTDVQDLENAELEVQIEDVIKDIDGIQKKDFDTIETTLSNKMKKTSEGMKVALREFLLNEKGLSASEVNAIEEEISKRIQEEVNKNIQQRTESIEEQVDQAMHIELDGLIEEDKYIIDRAKSLGLVRPTGNSNGERSKNSDVDLIEKDIASVRDNFDEYLEDLTRQITSELKSSIQGILEDVEKKVLQEKGVKLTENELDRLIKEENKN